MVTDRFAEKSDGASLRTLFDSDLKSTYCFCAHMHEITKYFLFTENQEQMSESVLSHPCRAGCGGVVVCKILQDYRLYEE